MNDIFEIEVLNNKHEPVRLERYRGDVLLVVNVASKCGFTPQYAGLESLYKKWQSSGFQVLGFPCNQFGSQEPGSDEEIAQFCELQYSVSFPLFEKIDVNGENASPLYRFLKQVKPGLLGTEAIKWNFTKFLISRSGEVLARFAPSTTPEALSPELEQALAEPRPS